MQDIDGDGIYVFATDQIPGGSYEFKVALDEDWAVSYPASNVPFSVSNAGDIVQFTYDSSDNSVDVTVTPSGGEIPPEIAALVTPPSLTTAEKILRSDKSILSLYEIKNIIIIHFS